MAHKEGHLTLFGKVAVVKSILPAAGAIIEGGLHYPNIGPDGIPYASKTEREIVQAAFTRELIISRRDAKLSEIPDDGSKRNTRRRKRITEKFGRAEVILSLPAVVPTMKSLQASNTPGEMTHEQQLGAYGMQKAKEYLTLKKQKGNRRRHTSSRDITTLEID